MNLSILWQLVLVASVAAVFYIVVPGMGAFHARAQWRRFRRTLLAVSRCPMASPARIGREKPGYLGCSRFFGTLEAIQGEERIWITDGRQSVAADLGGVTVYILPPRGAEPGASGEEVRGVPWGRIFSLPEGTPMFVGGALHSEDGRGVFRSRGREKLLVVIHDCPRESIVAMATWSGRHRNEYANAFTLPSLVTGSLSLAALAYTFLTTAGGRLAAIAAITAALGPAVPFLPPAVPLYFAYRRAWRRARLMRAQRDVVQLPLRSFPSPPFPAAGSRREQMAALLPDMEPYLMLRGILRPGRQAGELAAMSAGGMQAELPPETEKLALELPRARREADRGPPAGTGEAVAFGCYREEGEGIRLVAPADPMAPLIIVPGDPADLAARFSREARRLEVVSAVLISLNVAANAALLFVLLALAIR